MRANKFTFSILSVLLLVLLLIGCSGQDSQQPTPSASTTFTPPLPTATTYTLATTETPQATATVTPTLGPTLTPTKVFNNNVEKGDYLIYHLYHDKKLFFYDPVTDIHIPLLPDWEINTFAVSMNDQIAFSSTKGEHSDIYILNYPYWENSPINITNTQEINEYPDSWSPDGNYLLLKSISEKGNFLVAWDGSDFNNIHEFTENTQMSFSGGAWSQDGKYAFEVYPDYNASDLRDEIYVWNGNPEESAVNISQNPYNADRFPTWSQQGDLAFLSSEQIGEENVYSITIWEELTIMDGVLSGAALDIGAPELLNYLSFPHWTNTGSLVFLSMEAIYEWNGEQVTPMNIFGNYGYPGYWGPSGYWVSIGYWGPLYIHNESNETILELEGMFYPAWSPGSLLAFCVRNYNNGSFIISIWNGYEVIRITEYNRDIDAMWRNGEAIYCSNG